MAGNYYKEVQIPVDDVILPGELVIPEGAGAIVIFSHGSGSSRKSKRNQEVARYLQMHHFGTFLFDLLTREEDRHYFNRFNIDLLAARLSGATDWLERYPAAGNCSFGYFGASTGAASALQAASYHQSIAAIVSRGGRPDLAMDFLPEVKSPVLLIVGSLDEEVLELNRKAFSALRAEKRLEIVEGAGHLFEEPGKLSQVASLATSWFNKYLKSVRNSEVPQAS